MGGSRSSPLERAWWSAALACNGAVERKLRTAPVEAFHRPRLQRLNQKNHCGRRLSFTPRTPLPDSACSVTQITEPRMSSSNDDRDISITSSVAASEEQVSSDLAGETILLSMQTAVYYGLDEVGSRIWELVRAPIRVFEV